MVFRSAQRLAMRLSKPACSNEHLSAYSAKGPMSVFSWRMRYNVLTAPMTDHALSDYYYEKFLHSWCADVPSYNYWWVMSFALGAWVAAFTRTSYFNPDVTWRKQEAQKPMPDRYRQWQYSLPYHNHRLRNMVSKYRWALIDNEPDWADINPLGVRPNRKQCYARPYAWIFTCARYQCQDPLYTSCTHENMNRMYKEIGYAKDPLDFTPYLDEEA
mmetsp:Transcript_59513/g.110164  ORF Transcript_59513/g.110164 Transcript_59513/m.110164 type:complete len:215 (-) Transcript_59513:96-740(-)